MSEAVAEVIPETFSPQEFNAAFIVKDLNTLVAKERDMRKWRKKGLPPDLQGVVPTEPLTSEVALSEEEQAQWDTLENLLLRVSGGEDFDFLDQPPEVLKAMIQGVDNEKVRNKVEQEIQRFNDKSFERFEEFVKAEVDAREIRQ